MKYLWRIISLVFMVALATTALNAQAATTDPGALPTFYKAKVALIVSEDTNPNADDGLQLHQQIRVELLTGPDARSQYVIDYYAANTKQRLNTNQTVVVTQSDGPNGPQYQVADAYRLPQLAWLFSIFVIAVFIFARGRGLSSLIGLTISILILAFFVFPQIIAGHSPLLISFIGALGIAVISMYLAHGFSRRTTIALISTLLTIGLATLLAVLIVPFMHLFGLGSDEATQLQVSNINLRGLLMGGIIIGALGVLNDITTAQAAAVDEIHEANPALPPHELIKRGLSVGREHITSLINTLALAYVGAAFPLILLFTIYPKPLWVIINSEQISEEIARTVVGSLTLMVAVPITTGLAAYLLFNKKRHE